MENTYILSQQQKNEIEALLNREPDLSDIPEITDDQAARLKPVNVRTRPESKL